MPVDPLPNPRKPLNKSLVVTLSLLLLTMVGSIVVDRIRWTAWEKDWAKLGPIEATGGLFFKPKLALKVPIFHQFDDRWRTDKLGATSGTLGAEGCAVASAAMVLASYGVDTDPGRLNHLLAEGGGYTPEGWLYWEKAAELTGNVARKVYEDLPSYRLIDENLQRGNPVIVRLRMADGVTHFVVIAGKEGYDYLTCDPGANDAKGLYPLKEYGSKIEALRFYQRVK